MKPKPIQDEFIWVFQNDNANFPSAVFGEQQIAMTWIDQNQLTGILTGYPINIR